MHRRRITLVHEHAFLVALRYPCRLIDRLWHRTISKHQARHNSSSGKRRSEKEHGGKKKETGGSPPKRAAARLPPLPAVCIHGSDQPSLLSHGRKAVRVGGTLSTYRYGRKCKERLCRNTKIPTPLTFLSRVVLLIRIHKRSLYSRLEWGCTWDVALPVSPPQTYQKKCQKKVRLIEIC